MSPIFRILNEIFLEIIQKNGWNISLRTTADLAAILNVSPPHLSRIKNGKSLVGDEVLLKAFAQIDKLEKNVEQRDVWKDKLKE
ncbi:MAG TPA: hypothetical protein VGO47_07740, partial [Chlamydiales bacterium]|nr:hypothetical protein [Chlamydiales bacterium]